MRHAGFLSNGKRTHVGLVIDRPGVLRRAGARSQARDQRIEALAADAVAGKGRPVGSVAEADGRAPEQLRAVLGLKRGPDPCARPHEAHDVVTALDERGRRRAADRAGRAQKKHPFCSLGPQSRGRRCDIHHRTDCIDRSAALERAAPEGQDVAAVRPATANPKIRLPARWKPGLIRRERPPLIVRSITIPKPEIAGSDQCRRDADVGGANWQFPRAIDC